MVQMQIRSLKENDIEEVSKLLCSCYRWLADVEKYNEDELNFLLTKRGSVETVKRESAIEQYFVAYIADKINGMISLKENHITKLYVHPDYHGRGIGKELFEFAKDEITRAGFDEISTVAIGESVLPFYEKMGMHIIARKKSRAPGFEGRVGINLMMSIDAG